MPPTPPSPTGRRARARARPAAPPYLAEPLEPRTLLSITWPNRGNNVTDSDGFAALFGANAPLARQIVDRALLDWQNLIPTFGPGATTFPITISAGNAGSGALARGGPSAYSGAGVPTAGGITIDNTGSVHWLDPTPFDDAEFTSVTSAFSAIAPPATVPNSDFYTTALHEIGHTLGIVSGAPAALNNSTTTTNVDDPSDDTPGNLQAVNFFGGPIEATMTAADPGHFWEGPANAASAAAGLPTHPNDLMNSGRAINSNERNLISPLDLSVLSFAYGYSTLSASRFGNFYAHRFADGSLNINTPGIGADTLDLRVVGPNLEVFISLGSPQPGDNAAFTALFPLSTISSININTAAGADRITFSPISASVPIAINGIGSAPAIVVNGSAGFDAFTIAPFAITSTGINIAYSTAVTTFNANGGPADIDLSSAFGQVTINGSAGDDALALLAASRAVTVTVNAGAGHDTISVAPTGDVVGAALTLNGDAGNDTFHLAPISFGAGNISAPVTVNGGNDPDTLVLTAGNLDALTSPVTFNGGGGGGNAVTLNDTAPLGSLSYDITNTTVTRGPLFAGLTYAAVSSLTLQANNGASTVRIARGVSAVVHAFGNDGNDNFVVGGGNLDGFLPQDVVGGNGNDTLTYDDSANFSGKTWDINETFHPNEIIYSGLISLFTTGFESVAILAGLGTDNISFNNDVRQHYTVDGGQIAGNTIRWNAADNWFRNPFGPDAQYTVDLTVGPAGASNLLIFEDLPRGETDYFVTDSLVNGIDTVSSLDGFNVVYRNADFLTINGSDQRNTFQFVAASPTTSTYSFFARGGNDRFDIALDPALPAPAIRTDGNNGTDSLFITDSPFPTPATYTFTSVLTRTSPLDSVQFSYNTMENVTVTGSAGDDTFNVNNAFAGNGLALRGGPGNDTLNFGNNNIAAGITNLASFAFDGQADHDTFNLLNANDAGNWTYTRQAATIHSIRPGYGGVILSDLNNELMTVAAGPGNDTLALVALPAGAALTFLGAAGNDTLHTPNASLDPIRGPVHFDGQGGTDNFLSLVDQVDPNPNTAHLDLTSVGAYPGDNLFGPGGSVTFANLARLNLTFGPGADTLALQPLPDTTLTLDGGNPAAAPGDSITFGLASTLDPAFSSFGSFRFLTSSNRRQVTYVGFETFPPPDDVAPAILRAQFNAQPPPAAADPSPLSTFTSALVTAFFPSVTVFLSEPLAFNPGAFALNLTDLATGAPVPVGPENYSAQYDDAALTLTFTFDNFPAGLPAGLYAAAIAATSIIDPATNPAQLDFTWSFLYLPAAAALALPPAQTTAVQALYVHPSATLDLAAGSLLLDYDPNDPDPYETLRALLASAFDPDGLWSGPGITSSAARARATHAEPGPLTTLALSTAPTYTTRTGLPTFADLPLDDTTLIIKHTYVADASLDGLVSDTDVDLLYANYQDSSRPDDYTPFFTDRLFTDADFTFDGQTDDRDLDLLASTFDPLAPAL